MTFKSETRCSSCNYTENARSAKSGICQIKKGTDGLPVMCVGNWAAHKHYYLEKYLDLFVRAMTKSWEGNIYYIDLFCGPGRCILRETEEEIDGSPLIALKYKFAGYFFVDIEEENIKTLKQRCKGRNYFDKASFIVGDCNQVITKIKEKIPKRSLSVALIDPFGLDFDFSSYEKLTSDRRVDLIINFPLGTAIKRNYRRPNSEKLNTFFGGRGWRKSKITNPGIHFINYYKKNLKEIGYKYSKEFEIHGDISIKTIKKKVPLYHLLFASKHLLGASFWNKIRKFDPSGQRSLF